MVCVVKQQPDVTPDGLLTAASAAAAAALCCLLICCCDEEGLLTPAGGGCSGAALKLQLQAVPQHAADAWQQLQQHKEWKQHRRQNERWT